MTPARPVLATPGLAVDLAAEPWRYPGPRAPGAGVLLGDVFEPLLSDGVPDDGAPDALGRRLEAVLAAAGAPGLAARTAVVAVGANGAPAVLAAKLRRGGAQPVAPMLPGRVADLAVGHSAHVSRAGYVAAAPYRAPGARAPVVVVLLTADQVRCVDATEPNYARRRADVALDAPLPLRLAGALYVSRHGVLAGGPAAPGGEVLTLGPQRRVWAHLRAAGALPPGLPDDDRDLAVALAADASRREEVRTRLHALGLVRRCGLSRRAA
jgi:hypothetical protein